MLRPHHHAGFIDWDTYAANHARIATNTRPRPHAAGGAVREGAALLQGLATCGRCGRRLKVYYQGQHATPGYPCPGSSIVNGRGSYCMRGGGGQIDAAIAQACPEAVRPAGIEAALGAEATLEAEHDQALARWHLAVERARARRARRFARSAPMAVECGPQ